MVTLTGLEIHLMLHHAPYHERHFDFLNHVQETLKKLEVDVILKPYVLRHGVQPLPYPQHDEQVTCFHETSEMCIHHDNVWSQCHQHGYQSPCSNSYEMDMTGSSSYMDCGSSFFAVKMFHNP